ACEEPPPRRIKEVPTERWDTPPYPHGTRVTYKCRPGYMKLGRIVFECTDGAWKQQHPMTECINKPCGHPGDTEFGSFELTTGTEFVFGARVEYRCNDGYQMLSQRNYRECQADGWSNDIPHCEVVKCSPVKAPENGRIMAGAFELNREYSFGQLVNFECNEKYKLVGSKEIICSSNGQWNSEVPRCQEIICDVPQILHGYVRSPKAFYKESERLQFACEEGYRYGERADVQCTESGWNPTPYCTEIACFPPRIPNGIFGPQEDNYRLGDEITVQCNPGYYFKASSGKNTAECTKYGWKPDPNCVEKLCDYPVIENGILYQSRDYYRRHLPARIGQSTIYKCNSGYSTQNGDNSAQVVCSKQGWHPEPKCYKNCDTSYLENGYFLRNQSVFNEDDKIKYRCNKNFHAEQEDGVVTCTKNGWSPPPRCIYNNKCQNISFDNGYFTFERQTFNSQDATYRCHTGYVTPEGQQTGKVQCQKNRWTPSPKCIRACKTHLKILNYPANKTVFMPEDTIEYACWEGYHTPNNMSTGSSTCGINGEWSPAPQCLAIKCEVPTLPHGNFAPKRNKYHNGDVVKFTCAYNYVRVGPASSQCYYFGWFPSAPECKVNARDCGPPPEITNGIIAGGPGEQYQHGDKKQYKCNIEFKLVGSKEIECVDGQWSSPPSCIEDKMPCGSPSSIPNVVFHQKDPTQFSHGVEVFYRCKQASGNSEKMKIKCLNGEWKPLPLCADLSPQCVLPTHVELVHDGYLTPRKQPSFHRVINYTCISAEKSIKQATCVSGRWSPEIECTDEERTCPPPPQVPHARQITAGRNYKNGSKIAFSCLKNFQLIGANEITCIEGKWQSPPYCVERPCLPPQHVECADVPMLENQDLKMQKEGKTIYLTGAKLKYVARSGYKLAGPSEITCSMGNWTSAPTCIEMPCGIFPKVANAQIEGRNKKIYEPGETIRYQCDAGFLVVGPPEIICREGNWTAPPFCQDLICGAAPEIPDASIKGHPQERYRSGAKVYYECQSNFQMTGQNYVTCENGQWSQVPTCTDMKCEPPPEIAGGNIDGVKKSRYMPGESALYQCWKGFQMTGAATVMCQNGTWGKLPTCKGQSQKCGSPPVIENGELLLFAVQEYLPGDTVEYKCPNLYVMEGSQKIVCNDGQWTSPPVCLMACTASEEDMARNNIELKWKPERYARKRLYSRSGDFIEFKCRRGYLEDPASSPFRVQCMEGTLEYPQCKPSGKMVETIFDYSRLQVEHFHPSTCPSGDYILFECKWLYQQVSCPETLRAQCMDGMIKYFTCGCKCM
ncbi:CFAH factor, partial [Rostratula benghalensis]|nr:CFAH factor [Rostratula benghalensis]